MDNLETIEIKAFLPAKDFELSKQFYRDIGFTLAWASESLAYLHAGKSSFLLSDFYTREFAENLMMHLLVVDVDAWWRQIDAQDLPGRYGITVAPPEDRDWGLRDFTMHDPSGVLWRIGQSIEP
ncbi:glyoxalase [Solimonas sp. K1W22B-7]|uniref:VOC family protein n=1 Tax=Solimonas sp. K1W22B-7 TaxID=2303331 RepID=UPI000E330DEE|nr:VOC family protein [Solimonas sp. K1W22B-7]AXQ28173.1 glyoxalase [Solimonas sp. K1W22B-7]